MINRKLPLVSALTIALSACATSPLPTLPPPPRVITPTEPISAPLPRPRDLPPPRIIGFQQPQIMSEPGLDQVIRADANALQRQFGNPQLDVHEGDMRKLQFSGSACVLDIFLYPLGPGQDPVATWVEARRASDGAAVDRAACANALSGRR